jgi:hypothetical protein
MEAFVCQPAIHAYQDKVGLLISLSVSGISCAYKWVDNPLLFPSSDIFFSVATPSGPPSEALHDTALIDGFHVICSGLRNPAKFDTEL